LSSFLSSQSKRISSKNIKKFYYTFNNIVLAPLLFKRLSGLPLPFSWLCMQLDGLACIDYNLTVFFIDFDPRRIRGTDSFWVCSEEEGGGLLVDDIFFIYIKY